MLELNLQYIVDNNGIKKAVILNINEWKKIIEKLEMIDDIQAYDNAKANFSEVVSFDKVVKNIRN